MTLIEERGDHVATSATFAEVDAVLRALARLAAKDDGDDPEAALVLAERVEGTRRKAAAQRDAADQARREAESGTTQARHASKAASQRLDEIVRGAHRDE